MTIRIAAIALLAQITSLWAGQTILDFQVLEMEPKNADFLEKRLLEGGDAALEVEKNSPPSLATVQYDRISSSK